MRKVDKKNLEKLEKFEKKYVNTNTNTNTVREPKRDKRIAK